MIPRSHHSETLEGLLQRHPVVAILGARQVGKTTLARQLMDSWRGESIRFDLEDPDDLARLEEPKIAIGERKGLVVLDEVQRRPDLFPILRVLVDRPDSSTRFLLLGSASPDLLKQSSESLAGRIVYHDLPGFFLDEVGRSRSRELWIRGGFPRSFLAGSDAESSEWRRGFVRTFLERDLPQLGVRIPGPTLQRFWRMLAHYHAQTWNGAELARAFAVSASTVRRYLDLLTGALVVRQLPPWHENLSKRQVKSPKVYVADTGLLHTLLGLENREDVESHPKVGASWEGFVLQEVVARLGARPEECYFWATHAGAELDLLIVRGTTRIGVEIKRTTSPRRTRSLHSARESLGLDQVFLVHAGDDTFRLGDDFTALAFGRLFEDLTPLGKPTAPPG
jgi:predicted AAA+ superfamily ATPase